MNYPKCYKVIGKEKEYKPSEIERLIEFGVVEFSHRDNETSYYKYCE
jgi:hypothetical protein